MPASYHMYPQEIKLLTHDFSPATGGTFADPLTNTPAAPAITIVRVSGTGTLALVGSANRYTNTVTELITAVATVAADVYIVECLAYTTAGQRLQDNIQITIRTATEV